MSVLQILNELAADASGNAKKAILQREVKNETLKNVFVAAYNPYVSYGIKKIPQYTPIGMIKLDEAITSLTMLANRTYTGNAGVEYLFKILSGCNSDDATVIERIIDRDLRCGTSDSTSNKIWPGSVPGFDVMLCHKDISGIKFPAYCQEKSDGGRAHCYFSGGKVTLFTRSGKTVETLGVMDAAAALVMKDGETFDGEIVCYKDGEPLDRKTSNGIYNKGIKGTISKEEAELFRLVTWDIVDFSSTIPYNKRFGELENRFAKKQDKFMLIPSEIINSVDEADHMFAKALADGKEGCVLKNLKSLWVPKRSKDLGKMKAEEEADLIVTGWNEGTGKYAGMMGSLVCETSDGKLQVNVSGWDDADRKNLTEKNTKGKILTVRYNAIIDSKSKTTKSLFLPRAVEFRLDKTVANSLNELK